MAERGLRGFRVVHLVEYALRSYHCRTIAGMLQDRWDLKRRGGSELEQAILKLYLNSGEGGGE